MGIEIVFHRITIHLLSFPNWENIDFGMWCSIMQYDRETPNSHAKNN
jgi:hypothetical protein